MAISICRNSETLFALYDDGNALVPMDEGERAAVFEALTDALAVLADVKRPPTFATEDVTNCSPQTSPSRSDHKPCEIVRLSERRGTESGATSPE